MEKVEATIKTKEPNPRMFQLCQEEVYNVMENDLYPGFLSSEIAKEMIEVINADEQKFLENPKILRKTSINMPTIKSGLVKM